MKRFAIGSIRFWIIVGVVCISILLLVFGSSQDSGRELNLVFVEGGKSPIVVEISSQYSGTCDTIEVVSVEVGNHDRIDITGGNCSISSIKTYNAQLLVLSDGTFSDPSVINAQHPKGIVGDAFTVCIGQEDLTRELCADSQQLNTDETLTYHYQ